MPSISIFGGVADRLRAGSAIDHARAVSASRGECHLGFVAVIGETFHAETADGRSLGAFPTEDAAVEALSKAVGADVAGGDKDEPRHLALYDGRELIGSITGIGRDWRALDARGNLVPGAPFQSQHAAVAALNAVRPGPCAVDARLDNS